MTSSARKQKASRRRPAAARFSHLVLRDGAKEQIRRIAAENRLKLADAAEVLVEAWGSLSPEQRMQIICRPAEPAAAV